MQLDAHRKTAHICGSRNASQHGFDLRCQAISSARDSSPFSHARIRESISALKKHFLTAPSVTHETKVEKHQRDLLI